MHVDYCCRRHVEGFVRRIFSCIYVFMLLAGIILRNDAAALEHYPDLVSLQVGQNWTFGYDCQSGEVGSTCYYHPSMEQAVTVEFIQSFPEYLAVGISIKIKNCGGFKVYELSLNATLLHSQMTIFRVRGDICDVTESVSRPILLNVTRTCFEDDAPSSQVQPTNIHGGQQGQSNLSSPSVTPGSECQTCTSTDVVKSKAFILCAVWSAVMTVICGVLFIILVMIHCRPSICGAAHANQRRQPAAVDAENLGTSQHDGTTPHSQLMFMPMETEAQVHGPESEHPLGVPTAADSDYSSESNSTI